MDDLLLSNAGVMMQQAAQRDMSAATTALRESSLAAQSDDEIDAIATDFEAVFIAEMMKPMFKGIDIANSPFGGGKGEEIFQGLLLQEYGKTIAETQSLGVADQVRRMILDIQEAQQGTGVAELSSTNTTTQNDRTIGDVLNAYAAQ